MGLKIHVSLLSRFMYITSLSVDSGSEYFNHRWKTDVAVLNPQPLRRLKSSQMDLLHGYKTSF